MPEQAFWDEGSSVLAVLLFQFLLDAVALEVRQVIDEQLAVEVIAFVLDAHGQQAFGDQFKGFGYFTILKWLLRK